MRRIPIRYAGINGDELHISPLWKYQFGEKSVNRHKQNPSAKHRAAFSSLSFSFRVSLVGAEAVVSTTRRLALDDRIRWIDQYANTLEPWWEIEVARKVQRPYMAGPCQVRRGETGRWERRQGEVERKRTPS
jgi:hypothetical protein